MKKLFFLIGVAALVTLFAGQAIAGEWSWYGSVRMMAWRFNDEPAMGAGEDDEYTQFFMENPVSRVGAKIKAANKKVTARLEFGFYDEKDVLATGSSAAAGAKNDVEDNKAYLRLLYATWDFRRRETVHRTDVLSHVPRHIEPGRTGLCDALRQRIFLLGNLS